ncbi:MAG: DNA-binding domain-containing protein [Alphaproteobacteria bacterium]|nr:DNA-binding domain-containing protein [Alphaproteobacteria bacterium]
MADSALSAWQAWLQRAVLTGDATGAEAAVRGGNRLTAGERVAIYANGYRLRLLECLEREYPLLRRLAGPTAFGLFARGYLEAHPSRSWTLHSFGAEFADYLANARPANGDALSQLPAALARLERAQAEVARAPASARPSTDAGAPVLMEVLGSTLSRVVCPPTVRLLRLPFDCSALLALDPATQALPLPILSDWPVAVARKDWQVRCHPLPLPVFEWLVALPASGQVPPREEPVATWLPTGLASGIVHPLGPMA